MSYIEEAKRRIKECLENQETELHLGFFGIKDLNEIPELALCVQLKEISFVNSHNLKIPQERFDSPMTLTILL